MTQASAQATHETQETQSEEFKIPDDASTPALLGLRDGAIALAALSLWAAADTWHAVSGLGLAALLSVLDGLLVGAGLAALAHEWGHFAGARLTGGIAPTTRFASFLPLFLLDLEHSDPRSFRTMSVAGNVAHWLVVLTFALFLPLDGPGRVALLSAAFGFAVFASTTEIPIIRRAYAGTAPAACFVGLTGELLRRNQWIGAASGLALFLFV